MAGTPIKRAKREAAAAGLCPARAIPPDRTTIMRVQAQLAQQQSSEPSKIHKVMVDVLKERRMSRLRPLSDAEIDEVEQMVLACEVSDLKALMQADNVPIYLKGLISAIFTDMKNGASRTIETLRERQYGAIARRLEITGQDGLPMTSVQMTAQDARKMLEEINANC